MRDSEKGTLRAAVMHDRAGETVTGSSNTNAALEMLNAFASVGARVFDLSITDLKNNDPVDGLQRPGRSLDEMRRRIGRDLQDGERNRHNVIIRPRSTTALLIQLDDCSPEKAAQLAPYAFMTLHTSPGNCQVWLAVSDGPKESEKEAAKQFRKWVRRGGGSDKSATGATRIAGSINFKTRYAPDFPVVTLGQVNPGKTITTAALEQARLIDREEPTPPPRSVPPQISPSGPAAHYWPDYQRALRGAPPKKDGSGPDRSLADYMFCRWSAQRGWSHEEIAVKLLEVSEKAQEQARPPRNDEGYAKVTAWNAVQSVERERNRRPPIKSTARPG